MRAYGCGLRTVVAHNMPATVRSEEYGKSPRTFWTPSALRGDSPTRPLTGWTAARRGFKAPVHPHDQAGRAETTLDRACLEECFLHGVQGIGSRESLHGDHLAALCLAPKDKGRTDKLPVHIHRPLAALH